MSSEEKKQILKMIDSGKITAEEALTLIAALDENPVEGEVDDDFYVASPNSGFEPLDGLNSGASKIRRFWYIPVWIGVGITVLGGVLMFWAMQTSGFGFWFYCAWLPFLLGVLVVALAAGGHSSHWIFVHIKHPPNSTEKDISLGIPLPSGLGMWALRNFGHYIPNVDKAFLSGLLRILEESPVGEPQVVVDVQEDDGEQVQVFIA